MKNLLTATKITLLSLLIASSAAFAQTPPSKSLDLNGFKIAVIKNATGTEAIVSGDYLNGINNIINENDAPSAFEKAMGYSTSSTFEKSMGLCVANLKVNRLAKAELACTNAIEAKSGLAGRGKHNKYLKALAYSNRGIVRYQANSPLSAIDDFNAALKLDRNKHIKENVTALKTAIAANYQGKINNGLISE